ncbi:MAG: pyridoxamine 5'-phosphate oxidase [Myxococcota bacterium]
MTSPIDRIIQELARAEAGEPFDAARAALATVDPTGGPDVRFVLVRQVSSEGLVFFTNYESRKAHQLERAPVAALAFHWHTTGIQVRARGPVKKASPEASDAYFASRHRGSQIGAWASPQSQPIRDREELEARVREFETRFADGAVPRPPHWGGFVLTPHTVEFWHNRESRLHDRREFQRADDGTWSERRLAP